MFRTNILIIILIFSASLAGCFFHKEELTEVSHISPNKTYEISIRAEKQETDNYFALFSLKKNGKETAKNIFLAEDSLSGSELLENHQRGDWVAENILHFGPNTEDLENPDQIKIINRSGKSLQYLRIVGRDKFLIFDIPRDGTIQLLTDAQTDKTADISWIGAAGKSDDGTKLRYVGTNFRIHGVYKSPAHYLINITEKGLQVCSPDFSGFGFNFDDKEIDLPKTDGIICK